jgi:hypothetical protein
MKRIGKLLLAVAVGASLPAMAMAQRGPGDPDRNGNQNRAAEGQRGFAGGRGPEAFAAGQAQRAERNQDFNRDRGPGAGFAGAPQAQRDDRRGDGNRFDGRRNDDRRFDNDRRPGNDPRFAGNRGFNDGRYDNRRIDDRRFDNGRRGDNRWAGNNWRQDRRYDWRGYRDANRGRFQIGRYNAPRGWGYGYRRFSIGAVVPGLLWSNSYWLNDPYSYRLPPVSGPYRWVRYYDDVLLIDVRDGRVVDSIPSFFW